MRRLAFQFGAAHAPRARDVHQQPIPRWGGLAVFAAFLLSVVALALVVQFGLGREVSSKAWQSGLGIVLAGAILSVVGAVDDRRDLSAGKQLLVQLGCAILVLPFGVVIRYVSNPLGDGLLDLGWLGYPLTVLWLVGVANAVNWIDGIDGLAAGVSAISAFTMALMAAWTRQPSLALLAACLGGSLLGFLRYNFNPATIFLGGGAPVVGFLLASIATVGAFKAPVALALAVPFLLLALPLYDTTAVILKRWRSGKPIHQADKSHLHHRLLEKGYSQRKTVLILYGISLACCAMALWVFLSTMTGSRG